MLTMFNNELALQSHNNDAKFSTFHLIRCGNTKVMFLIKICRYNIIHDSLIAIPERNCLPFISVRISSDSCENVMFEFISFANKINNSINGHCFGLVSRPCYSFTYLQFQFLVFGFHSFIFYYIFGNQDFLSRQNNSTKSQTLLCQQSTNCVNIILLLSCIFGTLSDDHYQSSRKRLNFYSSKAHRKRAKVEAKEYKIRVFKKRKNEAKKNG